MRHPIVTFEDGIPF